MAKSTTEMIREVTQELAIESARSDERDRRVDRLERVLERLEVQLNDKLGRLEQRLTTTERENAALKQQVQDHVSQYQEWGRRRWGLIILLFGTVLSLASGLIVTLAKK